MHASRHDRLHFILLPLLFIFPLAALGQFGSSVRGNPDQIAPGEFVIDPPTLQNLGFEWFIDGDDNRNASIKVTNLQ